jgi:hypothetical protein
MIWPLGEDRICLASEGMTITLDELGTRIVAQ